MFQFELVPRKQEYWLKKSIWIETEKQLHDVLFDLEEQRMINKKIERKPESVKKKEVSRFAPDSRKREEGGNKDPFTNKI